MSEMTIDTSGKSIRFSGYVLKSLLDSDKYNKSTDVLTIDVDKICITDHDILLIFCDTTGKAE